MEVRDLKDVTIDDFKPKLGNQFLIEFAINGRFTADLIDIKQLSKHKEGGRIPFILTFRTNQKNEYYEQGIYAVSEDDLGMFELFLCPKGPDEAGMKYEAVFG